MPISQTHDYSSMTVSEDSITRPVSTSRRRQGVRAGRTVGRPTVRFVPRTKMEALIDAIAEMAVDDWMATLGTPVDRQN